MSSWFSKWRISSALDAGKPFPESLRRKIAADPELERFAKQTETMGKTLRNFPVSGPDFHGSIMSAVRASARREEPRRSPALSWLAVSGALAALAIVFFYLTVYRPKADSRQEALAGPVKVLEWGETVPASMPTLISPLSNEWARMDRDLQSTKQVLLASLP
jgi:hypothetical protein